MDGPEIVEINTTLPSHLVVLPDALRLCRH